MQEIQKKISIISIIAFILLIIGFPCTADSTTLRPLFSAGVISGLQNGTIREYVFNTNNDAHPLMSQLNWDVSTLLYAGIESSLTWRNFFMYGTVTAAIPRPSGLIKDYDWLTSDPELLTNYSQHNNNLDQCITGHLRAGWLFSVAPSFRTGPVVGITGRKIAYTGSDGYRQYLSDNQNTAQSVYELPKTEMTGDIISYEQQQTILLLGWTGLLTVSRRIQCACTFFISPANFIDAYDMHFLKNLLYYDTIVGSLYTVSEFTITYMQSERTQLKLQLRYENQPICSGSTLQQNRTSGLITQTKTSNGGTDFSMLSIQFAVVWYW